MKNTSEHWKRKQDEITELSITITSLPGRKANKDDGKL